MVIMLSPNFSLEEMTVSETATRRDIENVPDRDSIENLESLCANILEPLRSLLNAPVLITSGYRSPFLNQAIGGSKTSQHCFGMAADIHCNKFTIEELYQIIKASNLPYFQLIQEYNRWCHVSYNGAAKRENLRALKNSEGDTYYVHD